MATFFGGAIGSSPIASSPVASTRPGDAVNSVATASGITTLSGKSGRRATSAGVATSLVVTSSKKVVLATAIGNGSAVGLVGMKASAVGSANSQLISNTLFDITFAISISVDINFQSGSTATANGIASTLITIGSTGESVSESSSSVYFGNIFETTFSATSVAFSFVETNVLIPLIAISNNYSVAYGATFMLRPTYNHSYTRGQAFSELVSSSINESSGTSECISTSDVIGSATTLVTATAEGFAYSDADITSILDSDFNLSVAAYSNAEGETGVVSTATSESITLDNIESKFYYGANAISYSFASAYFIAGYNANSSFNIENNSQINCISEFEIHAPVEGFIQSSSLSYALTSYKLSGQGQSYGSTYSTGSSQPLVAKTAYAIASSSISIQTNSIFSSIASSNGLVSVNVLANSQADSFFSETQSSVNAVVSRSLSDATGNISGYSSASSHGNSSILSVAHSASITSSIFLSDNSAIAVFNLTSNSQTVFYAKSFNKAIGNIQGNASVSLVTSKLAKVVGSASTASDNAVQTTYAFVGNATSINTSLVFAITSAIKASQSESNGTVYVNGDGAEYVERIRLYSNTSIGIGYALTSIESSLPNSNVDISVADSIIGSGTAITETADGQSDTLIIF